MSNLAKRLDQPIYSHILDMARLAGGLGKKENIRVYIVGGVVRDLILNRKTTDISAIF